MSFVVRVILNAAALWVATLLLGTHFVIEGGESTLGTILVYLGVALLFALVNAIVKPIIKALSFVLYILTLGLFGLVVNALMLMLVGWITTNADWGLTVENFGWAVLAGIIVAIVNGALTLLVPGARRR